MNTVKVSSSLHNPDGLFEISKKKTFLIIAEVVMRRILCLYLNFSDMLQSCVDCLLLQLENKFAKTIQTSH